MEQNLWQEDLLGFDDLAATYTNLIRSLNDSRTISIEAGFGRGKTYFRSEWAKELRATGEVVFEIDAQQSDHSGDPVVTFLGALVGGLPKPEKGKGRKAAEAGKKYASLAARTVAQALIRNAADELIETLGENALDEVEGMSVLEDTVKELGSGMSKLAGNLIAAQMAAEQVRQKEMPEQLDALHNALTEGRESNRVIIFIDELDRCHPDYAIALLEAMKLVFDHDGFIFVLFVNADYLENLAAHRFGSTAQGEKYLDKFVDVRLGLPVGDKHLAGAAEYLARQLPLATPYGDDPEFSVERAGQLAGEIAPLSGLSMRQIKAVLLKVELACRCYGKEPLDLPLLVLLAFRSATGRNEKNQWKLSSSLLPRAALTPKNGAAELKSVEQEKKIGWAEKAQNDATQYVRETFPELMNLPPNLYRPGSTDVHDPWRLVFEYLAPHYIPDHQAKLDAIYKLQAGTQDTT